MYLLRMYRSLDRELHKGRVQVNRPRASLWCLTSAQGLVTF